MLLGLTLYRVIQKEGGYCIIRMAASEQRTLYYALGYVYYIVSNPRAKHTAEYRSCSQDNYELYQKGLHTEMGGLWHNYE